MKIIINITQALLNLKLVIFKFILKIFLRKRVINASILSFYNLVSSPLLAIFNKAIYFSRNLSIRRLIADRVK